jgi:glutamate dehydrogenase/leucine dehydrogenase
MRFTKLEGTDAFVVHDLDAARTSVGVARLAPKVLRDGAELLARSATYAFAAFGVEGHGGAAAGINAKPEGRDAAIAAFGAELEPQAASGALRLSAGVGLSTGDLGSVGYEPDLALLAEGAAICAAAAPGGLAGSRVAVAGAPPAVAGALRAALGAHGVTDVVDGDAVTPCDVLFVAGKAGAIDHDAAPAVAARVIVPLSPVPVTARAYAVLRKADRTYVPDFLSIAAPLLAVAGVTDPPARVRALAGEVLSAGPGAFLVAVGLAEAFLSTWQGETPFGRPLA